MKNHKWMSGFQGAVLAFLLSIGAMEALVTGFHLPLERPWMLWAVCAGVSALCAGAAQFQSGLIVLMILGAAGLGYLRGEGSILPQLMSLISRITYLYDRGYHTGWLQLAEEAGVVDRPLEVWGTLIAAVAAISVVRRWPGILAIIFGAAPLGLCFVLTDTPPASWSLGCFMLSTLVMLFTSGVRRRDPAQGNRLALLTVVPIGAALAVLAAAVPMESYVNNSEEARLSLARWMENIRFEIPQTGGIRFPGSTQAFLGVDPARVELRGMGELYQSSDPVMYVQADVGGTLYLRGRDYDVYDGRSWQATADRQESFGSQGEPMGTVQVQTLNHLDRMYLPYYPMYGETLVGGEAPNRSLFSGYSVPRMGLPGELYSLLAGAEPSREPMSEYLALPEASFQRLREIAQPLTEGVQTATGKAEQIAAFVRSSAVYDKRASRMGTTESDFVLWFLENSDRGYCVHFASATVALLRSVGVEARYVVGYMVWAQPGERTVVTGENAHAWAEYYEPRVGMWIPLEATPAEGQPTAVQFGGGEELVTLPTAGGELPQPLPTVGLPWEQPTLEPELPGNVAEHTPDEPAAERPVPERTVPSWLVQALAWVLALAAIVLTVEGQRRLRLTLRRKRQHSGPVNAQALARWREVELLAKLLGEKPEEELEQLAQKAKFSQYTLTESELGKLERAIRQGRRRLSRENLGKRMIYRYIFGII